MVSDQAAFYLQYIKIFLIQFSHIDEQIQPCHNSIQQKALNHENNKQQEKKFKSKDTQENQIQQKVQSHKQNQENHQNHGIQENEGQKNLKVQENKQGQQKENRFRRSRNTKSRQILTDKIVQYLIAYLNSQKQYSLAYIGKKLGLSIKKVNQARNQYYQTRKIKTTQQWRNETQDQKYVMGRVSKRFKQASKLIGQILEKNPSISAETIRKQLTNREVLVKTRSFYYLLHQQGYVYRRLQQATFSKNTPQVIQQRFQYTQELKDYNLDQLIYISETTFNASNFITHGWVKKSQINKLKVPQNPNNVSVLAVANIERIVAYVVKRGPIDAGQVFNLIIDKILPVVRENDILIIGPLKVGSANEIKQYFRDKRLTVKNLPQFSPQLNPLESFFSVAKSCFRKLRLDKRMKDPKVMQKTVIQLMEEQKNENLQKHFKKMRDHFRLAQKRADFEHYL